MKYSFNPVFIGYDNTDTLTNYIVTNNIHIAYARKFIKRIASNPKNIGNVACMDIVNSGYTQAITQDIEQDVFISLLNSINNAHCGIACDIVTHEYTFVLTRTAILDIFRSIQHTLASYKTQHDTSGKITNYDSLIVSDNKDTTIKKTTKNNALNSNYLASVVYDGGLNDVALRTDISALFEYIRSIVSDKKYHVLYSVFACLCGGYTSEQIAQIEQLTVDVVKKARQELRIYYNTWKNKGNSIQLDTHEISMQGTTTYTSANCFVYRNTIDKQGIKADISAHNIDNVSAHMKYKDIQATQAIQDSYNWHGTQANAHKVAHIQVCKKHGTQYANMYAYKQAIHDYINSINTNNVPQASKHYSITIKHTSDNVQVYHDNKLVRTLPIHK